MNLFLDILWGVAAILVLFVLFLFGTRGIELHFLAALMGVCIALRSTDRGE